MVGCYNSITINDLCYNVEPGGKRRSSRRRTDSLHFAAGFFFLDHKQLDDDENENGGTSDGNGSEAGDSVSTDLSEMAELSELSELSEQANPLERTLDAVEALRLYVKTSGMPRTVMSSLNRACNAVKEQQRVQQSMSSWGASWTPYKEAEDSTRIRKLRQKSLRVTSRGGSMLKQTSVASSKNVHVSKHPPTGKKNGLGLRSSSVF